MFKKAVAVILLTFFSISVVHGEVLIDLDFVDNTAKNSKGILGDGTVVLRSGSFVSKKEGNKASDFAFETGADAMGTKAKNGDQSGAIIWQAEKIKQVFGGLSTFSTYAWLKPKSELSDVARLLYNGNLDVAFQNNNIIVKINGKATYFYFHDLAKKSVNKWIFVGLKFSQGEQTVCVGYADGENLLFKNALTDQAKVTASTHPLTLGNMTDFLRPFQGAIGAFYFSNDSLVDFNAVFNATRTQY